MNAAIKTRWVDALRSGDYEQAQRVLHPLGTQRFCCLGVLCDLYLQEIGEAWTEISSEPGSTSVALGACYGETGALPLEVVTWAGLANLNPDVEVGPTKPGGRARWSSLASLNDHGSTFVAIADLIEAQL
jgi:hypothetical protein